MSKKNYVIIPDSDLEELIRKALGSCDGAATPTAIQKLLPRALRPPPRRLTEKLQQLADEGRISRWPGKTANFGLDSVEDYTAKLILAALGGGASLSDVELKKKLPTAAKSSMAVVLRNLVADGKVRAHPKLNRRTPYALGAPDALPYLAAEMAGVLKRLAKLGFSSSAATDAIKRYARGETAPSPSADADHEGAVRAAMERINPQASRGALVSIAQLRQTLSAEFRDKLAFDSAVLALARIQKVQLQTHAWPSSLSAEEREALIDNGRGGYFDAIGLRME